MLDYIDLWCDLAGLLLHSYDRHRFGYVLEEAFVSVVTSAMAPEADGAGILALSPQPSLFSCDFRLVILLTKAGSRGPCNKPTKLAL